jgi:hypothetical protein
MSLNKPVGDPLTRDEDSVASQESGSTGTSIADTRCTCPVSQTEGKLVLDVPDCHYEDRNRPPRILSQF